MLAQLNIESLPILLIIGFALFAGGLGAKLFQRLRIPQVVGYILIGVVLGRSGFGFINDSAIESLRLFNFFALGVIGFMIGGELRFDVFRRHGKQLMIILLSEGVTAFLVVSLAVTLLAWPFMGMLPSIALGLVLGAIASATAPAATVDVLWEYKTRGPLTTTVFAIVALDDGLALMLYGVASSIAKTLIGHGREGGLSASLLHTAYELFGAVILGVLAGWLLNRVLRFARDHDKALTFIIGSLGVTIGLALVLEVDLILSTMALGMALINLAPRRSRESFEIIERFAPPIYVLFFVVVGARLSVGQMQHWMWLLAGAFVIGRSGGKILGAYLGARWSRASQGIRKYLGLCLFSQAGVAIGLAILASASFPAEIGNAVILIVTATTFIVQIIGPPCVKIAVTRAGEVGMNITRDDLVKEYRVGDVMNAEVPTLGVGDAFSAVLRRLRESDAPAFPVVDDERRLLGVVTMAELRSALGAGTAFGELLVASDLMGPTNDTVERDLPLQEALTRLEEQDIEYLLVTEPTGEETPPRLVGLLQRRAVDRRLNREIIRRQESAADREQTDLIRRAIARKKKTVSS